MYLHQECIRSFDSVADVDVAQMAPDSQVPGMWTPTVRHEAPVQE
jgi:hypothetical protein